MTAQPPLTELRSPLGTVGRLRGARGEHAPSARGRHRPWLIAVAVSLVAAVSTVASALFPSTSMVWPGSQSLSAGVAVNAAVNVHNRGSSDYSEYRVSAGHSHGPPTAVNVQFCHEQTYYVMAGTTPVLVHNCGTGGGATPAGGAHDPVPLYRNVDAAEFDSIASTGRFSPGAGNMEGKWFATQGEHADQWGQLLNNGDGLTVQTTVPRWVADQLHFHPGKLDSIGPGFYADADKLALVNRHMSGISLWPF